MVIQRKGNTVVNGGTKVPVKEKKENGYGRANIFSKILFCWMLPTFWKGLHRELNDEDLSKPHTRHHSDRLGDRFEQKWFEEVERASRQGRKPSLIWTMVRTFWWSYMPKSILIILQMLILKPLQPMALSMLLMYWEPDSTMTYETACLMAAAVIIMSLFIAFCTHHSYFDTAQFGMKIRISCCSLIYRKVLRMSSQSLSQITTGQVVNLLSNDVNRFDYAFIFTHYIWILPLQVVFVCYLIYSKVGYAAIIGVAAIVLQTIPVQSYMGKLTAKLRMETATRTDERVRIMDEIINGIQVIKMYAWEKPFEAVVALARKREISTITKASYLRGVYLSFMVFTERLALFVTILSYSLMGYPITADVVFPLAQFYNTIQMTCAIMYPNALSFMAECYISLKRIEEFLLLDERVDLRCVANVDIANLGKNKEKNLRDVSLGPNTFKKIESDGHYNAGFESNEKPAPQRSVSVTSKDFSVVMQDVNADWAAESPALRNLTVKINSAKLCAVIGSVGSGKSSVLQLLLKELQPTSGSVSISGNLSYASQEPWLFVATVRQNILFGLPYDNKRYKEVVRVCALIKDFQQFPFGDQTLVGERGVSLSGGQRARINLARCVYRQADIYLLDDPLSAVDAHVGRQLFDSCIKGYLRHKTRILVTHQLHYLKAADMIVIMNNGSVENMGTYDELVSSGKDFALLLSSNNEEKDDQKEKVVELTRKISSVSQRSIHRQSSTVSSDYGEDYGSPQELAEEERETGSMGWNVYGAYLKAGGGFWTVLMTMFILSIGQLSATLCDYWVTFWSNEATERMKAKQLNQTADEFSSSLLPEINGSSVAALTTHNQTDDFNINDLVGPLTTVQYLYVYTALIIACIILITVRSAVFFKMCMRASRNLHNDMFHSMLRGVMRFFDTNSSGRILNRFSKDMGALDEMLPRFLLECIQIFLVMFSILCLNAAALVWTLLPTAVILTLFYFILKVYLRSAQAIKRLEGTTRSPVFSHMSATLNGISTIRSSNASKRLIKEFDLFQDAHTSTWSSYIASGVTLGFWLDFICVVYLTIIVTAFLLIDSTVIFSGNVGLAISQTLILTGMLQFGIRQTAEVISQMTSVERILQYTGIEREKSWDEGTTKTEKSWPSNGRVEFRNVFMRYVAHEDPVLKNLNIVIESGWKVGIVGRTGAGKSSLISSLFRLALIEGEVIIDGVDTAGLALQELRAKISIIPQEPVLFSATIRYNLDPFNNYDDVELWKALEAVDLKDAIPALDFKVSEGGSNFSLGQRQLVCLARAILRANKILVLDEATANVDPKTDAFIQKTIRSKFASCTVLTVAHRLNTIMDSDRVMVMDTGRMVEFDFPYKLLCNSESHLSSMVKETGDKMASRLFEIAKSTYYEHLEAKKQP